MTSDERRLEVAASLRASANVGGARTLKRELARALGIRLDDYTAEGSHSKILRGLADLIDRPTCRNVYDESKTGACKNGFECSECGGVVEDGEGWLVNGTFNFCPECGASVVRTSD